MGIAAAPHCAGSGVGAPSLLTPPGSDYFGALPLPPLGLSIFNNSPTSQATRSPVSHWQLEHRVAKAIPADIVTLSWRLLPHLWSSAVSPLPLPWLPPPGLRSLEK